MKDESLLELVANLSEGRNLDVVEEIARTTPEVKLLDLHTDPDHNRSVITAAGAPGPLIDYAVEATKRASRLIDLRNHSGVHPRLGSMDLLPFVPLRSTPMSVAIETAHECARQIWTQTGIPCFFYEKASGEDRSLPVVRVEAFKRVRPDFGSEPHPTAGAVVVGAREVLVAFNIHLATDQMGVAVTIANAIRERDGGIPGVRAMAFPLRSRGCVQVSVNLVRPIETTIADVYTAVSEKARENRVAVSETELVGLAPAAAFGNRSAEELRLRLSPKFLEEGIDTAFPR